MIMQKISHKFLILSLLVVTSCHISWWECALSTVPSPPVQSYSDNIDTVIAAVKKLAWPQVCQKPAGYPSHLDVASPIQWVVQVLGNMKAAGYDLATLISEIRFYLDTSSKLSAIEQKHQNSILDIQNKILAAGTYVGGRCAANTPFTENITINQSGYKTKGRTLQQVLDDMYGQTTQVLKYYRNLIKQISSNEEYKDNTEFTLAPATFAKDMQNFYNADDIQKCSDEDPQNKAITDSLKKAWTTGWKYPQAIKIWKDAFALLLYRSSQIAWSDTSDPSKDAQIKNIVYSYKGWLSNSKYLINGSNLKEFGKRLANQPIQETIKQTWKRIAYENPGYLFLRQVIPNMVKTRGVTAKAVQVVQSSETENKRAETERSLYSAYAARKAFIWQNKAQDPKTVTSLVQALEELEKARAKIEENTKLACNDVLNKQATNVPHPNCTDFIKS